MLGFNPIIVLAITRGTLVTLQGEASVASSNGGQYYLLIRKGWTPSASPVGSAEPVFSGSSTQIFSTHVLGF